MGEMMHGLLIPTEGAPSVVPFQSLAGLQALVGPSGCYVERVRVGEDWALAVDEEGRYREKPRVNPLASLLYGTARHGTPIVGPAVLCAEGWTHEGRDWIDATPERLLVGLAELVAFRAAEVGIQGEIGALR